MAKIETETDRELVTVDKIAQAFRISEREVQRFVIYDGMPRVSRGQYDMRECLIWFCKYCMRKFADARDRRDKLLGIAFEFIGELSMRDTAPRARPVQDDGVNECDICRSRRGTLGVFSHVRRRKSTGITGQKLQGA